MPDNYENIRTHVMGPEDFGGTDEGSHYMAQGRIVTRNRSTPESRAFWDSAEKAAAPVADWPDSKRAGINVSDRRTTESERIVPRYEQIWISRSDYKELESHAQELERQLLDLTAERDRLLRGFTDAVGKHRVYRREIRRLQRALLVERGKGLSELEARVEALEGKHG